jgi:predicted membrane channel-forming protein YqfA (hemolysin III family)
VPASEALVAALPIDRRSHLSAAGAVKIERQVMSPQKKFHLVFSLIMGAMMIFVMTFVITLVNVGYSDAFLRTWMKALAVAYVVGVPVIFFLAPVARKLTGGLLGMPQ